MNYTVLVLGVWCIVQVVIAVWGLGMLDNKCNNLSLYTRLRTLLVISAVTATVFFANLMCNMVCYEDHEETSIWVAIFTLVPSLIVIFTELQIKSDIDDCADNTDNYKMVLLYAGIIPSIFPLLYGCWMIRDWFNSIKERRSVKERERVAARELARQQKEKSREEEQARRLEIAEEKERQAESIRKERQAKAEEQAAKAKARVEEQRRAAEVAREKAAKAAVERREAIRKRRGEYTAEERVAIAKERQRNANIEAAERKVEDLKRRIQDPNLPDNEITRLGSSLEKAQKELATAKSGERSLQQQGGWASMFND